MGHPQKPAGDRIWPLAARKSEPFTPGVERNCRHRRWGFFVCWMP